MTKKDAQTYFKEIYPDYKEKDKGEQRLLWSFYTDSLCKNNDITLKQYETWLYPSYFKK